MVFAPLDEGPERREECERRDSRPFGLVRPCPGFVDQCLADVEYDGLDPRVTPAHCDH